MTRVFFLEIYVLTGVLNAAFLYWSLRAQDRMMGGDGIKRPEWIAEAFFLWPIWLPMNLAMWAYVLIKSRKAQ